MIVVLEKNKNNKFELTKKELEELLSKARQEGYDEGHKVGYAQGYKYYIPTQQTATPFWESPFRYDKITVNGTGTNPELGKTEIIA